MIKLAKPEWSPVNNVPLLYKILVEYPATTGQSSVQQIVNLDFRTASDSGLRDGNRLWMIGYVYTENMANSTDDFVLDAYINVGPQSTQPTQVAFYRMHPSIHSESVTWYLTCQ